MKVATYNVCLHPLVNTSINQTQQLIVDSVLHHEELTSCDVICFQELYTWSVNRTYKRLIDQTRNYNGANMQLLNRCDITSILLGHYRNMWGLDSNEITHDVHVKQFQRVLGYYGFRYFFVSAIMPNELGLKSSSGLMIASKIPIIEQHEYLIESTPLFPNRTLLLAGLANGTYVATMHLTPTIKSINLQGSQSVIGELTRIYRHIRQICRHHKCVIAGDFNIEQETDLYQQMVKLIKARPITNPSATWKAFDKEACIYNSEPKEAICDYIIALNGYKYKSPVSTVLTIDASDHYPVIAEVI